MLNEIVNSIKATLYDRTSSPLFGSFVISWAVCNYRLLVVLLGDGKFAPYVANVDVSLKGCRDARFNARFSGFLHANAAAKEAKLTLNAVSWHVPNNKVQQASLEAVLRR